jgi:hypothetical protein
MCLCGYLQYFTILELRLKHPVIIIVSISISYRSIIPQISLTFLSRHEFSFAYTTITKRNVELLVKRKEANGFDHKHKFVVQNSNNNNDHATGAAAHNENKATTIFKYGR